MLKALRHTCWKIVSYVSIGVLIGASGSKLLAQSSELPAYYVAEIDVHDVDVYKTKYVPFVSATLAPYGGKYLAAGGKTEGVEGAPPAKRVVILQFPSMDKAKAWYGSKEYGEIKPVRHAAATTRSFIAEGRGPQP